MKKIEVLAWGVQHIASNHRGVACSTDWEEFQSMSIHDDAVPTLSDAQMLCEDVGLGRENCWPDRSWGFIVIDVEDWADTIGQQEYTPTGHEMWKKIDATIGE